MTSVAQYGTASVLSGAGYTAAGKTGTAEYSSDEEKDHSWFIGMSSRYALVYGSLASLIILLVWLYLCGNILLLGAVVGRVLEDRLKR